VAKRKLCVFCSFVQNNKEKSIDFFGGFSKKWQSFFEQNQVVSVLPFLCGFLEKKIFLIFPEKQVILTCKFKHYKVLLNRSKVCACYYYFYST
jgi:hypothetical protein